MGRTEFPEKILSPCHFVYHKTHMDWSGIEEWSPW